MCLETRLDVTRMLRSLSSQSFAASSVVVVVVVDDDVEGRKTHKQTTPSWSPSLPLLHP